MAGCASPKLQVTSAPERAAIWVDGRPAAWPEESSDPIERELLYYGTTQVHGRGAIEDWLDHPGTVEHPEPFSPWLFPLDFFLETVTYPWAGDRYRYVTEVDLPARPQPVIGKRPPGTNPLLDRARKATVAR